MAKHFIKLLAIFLVMIVLGLVGVYLVTYFGQASAHATTIQSNGTDIAK